MQVMVVHRSPQTTLSCNRTSKWRIGKVLVVASVGLVKVLVVVLAVVELLAYVIMLCC